MKSDYDYAMTAHPIVFYFSLITDFLYIFILRFINLTTQCNLSIYATWDNKGTLLKHNINLMPCIK